MISRRRSNQGVLLPRVPPQRHHCRRCIHYCRKAWRIVKTLLGLTAIFVIAVFWTGLIADLVAGWFARTSNAASPPIVPGCIGIAFPPNRQSSGEIGPRSQTDFRSPLQWRAADERQVVISARRHRHHVGQIGRNIGLA